MASGRSASESAVVLAPLGRDADVAAELLRESGIEAIIAPSVSALAAELSAGAGFAVVTEEALRLADLRDLVGFISGQEEWSDLPFIVLTARGGGLERNPAASRLLDLLGNVTFLERPFHPTTLLSLAQSALRARRRQYEARRRLETIREGEERLRLALAAGGLGAWELDISVGELDASDECKAHFGRRKGDPFTYADLLLSVHPDDRAYMQASVAHCQETGEDYSVEYRCIWPNGDEHWVQVLGRLERDASGTPLRMVGVSQDITDRRQHEAAQRDFMAELERQVAERARQHETVTAQLHEAQKLETLGQLTGGVAHDFNNLLTPVIGNLDLLRRRHDDERSQRLIASALQASERARTLVSRLLSFARRQNLEARPVDTSALLEGMLELVRRSLGPLIAVRVDISRATPPAQVDPNQLELALLNLAVNARDAMPEGGELTFSIEPSTLGADNPLSLDAGDYVTIAVRDTGMGMDAETLRRAVEPFYSTKGVGKGTGLGLSMVHGLAAQSGGKLELESRPGEGTTARIWLPVAEAPHSSIEETGDDAGPELDPLHILLVDDEELVRSGTAEMLEDMGHRVDQAASGAQALQKLRDQAFDVLISDYLMPGMTGVQLIEEMRRQDNDLPVLLITGFAAFASASDAQFGRIAKPFRRGELARALAGVVSQAEKLALATEADVTPSQP
ncbi:response regulator [Novosphingobium sp. PS1R-30]|uniref:histidine kinase n=1 Tax=Novosphingobium anseongense TaxID=3133436 RepID=A0ABU8RUK6_9SPHN